MTFATVLVAMAMVAMPVGIEGDGDAKAAAIYASAYEPAPEFYSFYRSLDAYRASFRNKTDVLVLDPSSEFFRYLKSPGKTGKK